MKYFFYVLLLFSTLAFGQESKTAYFASGCFWCVESIYEHISGVEDAISGYSGGKTANPTYQEISKGITGHAETVKVVYNPKKISFKNLVIAFFSSHDPTTKNGQYPDFGSQYRSIAFYQTSKELEIIKEVFNQLNEEKFNGKIVTELKKFDVFYPAEFYHQDFEKKNPNNQYFKKVSVPRLERFKKSCPLLLK